MVNTHPSESVASRRAGLRSAEALLPELGLDAQAFLRSWIAPGGAAGARQPPATTRVRR